MAAEELRLAAAGGVYVLAAQHRRLLLYGAGCGQFREQSKGDGCRCHGCTRDVGSAAASTSTTVSTAAIQRTKQQHNEPRSAEARTSSHHTHLRFLLAPSTRQLEHKPESCRSAHTQQPITTITDTAAVILTLSVLGSCQCLFFRPSTARV